MLHLRAQLTHALARVTRRVYHVNLQKVITCHNPTSQSTQRANIISQRDSQSKCIQRSQGKLPQLATMTNAKLYAQLATSRRPHLRINRKRQARLKRSLRNNLTSHLVNKRLRHHPITNRGIPITISSITTDNQRIRRINLSNLHLRHGI